MANSNATKQKEKSVKREYLFEQWCKVKELSQNKCTLVQIHNETGLDVKTIKRYLKLGDEGEARAYFFKGYHSRASPKKEELAQYEAFFLGQLNNPFEYTKAQILDHFMEKYPNVHPPSETTLNRYLDQLIKRHAIERPTKHSRDFRRRNPEGWGKEAEVDFGEKKQYTAEGTPHRVWFISVTLKASCYKFILFSDKKFDGVHAVYGMHLAFKYFQGVPDRVIFDQDPVFLVDDNYGDFNLTQALEQYARNAGFEADFCHAYDPQSKGRVERYVRFVKDNFLHGRKFIDIDTLNQEAQLWLRRTGNGKVHDIYRQTPEQMFREERKHLKAYNFEMENPDREFEARSVRKDNTIRYGGSLFDLPPGTYRGEGTTVRVDDISNPQYLLIKDILGNIIVQYSKDYPKHEHVDLPKGMGQERMSTAEKELRQRLDQWEDLDPLSLLIKNLKKEKKRYAYDVLKELNRISKKLALTDLMRVVKHCLDMRITSVKGVYEAMERLQIKEDASGGREEPLAGYDNSDLTHMGTSLEDYT